MKVKNYLFTTVLFLFTLGILAQEKDIVPNEEQGPVWTGTFDSMVHVSSISSRLNDITQVIDSPGEAKDRKSLTPQVIIGKDPQNWDDYLAANPNPASQSIRVTPPILVFDAFSSATEPTDPDIAVGPDHVFATWNTFGPGAFAIYDKSGNLMLGPTNISPAIFPSAGCCDLTVTYDTAADRWVLSYLFASNNQNIAVSDGPDPINDGWYIYSQSFTDYQKLSIWSDGYYMTQNNGESDKVFALERDAMLAGNPGAQIVAFNLPGIGATSPFFSPQFLNVSDGNMPAVGGATVVFLQDDGYAGISDDHVKYWTVKINWSDIGNSTISAATEILVAPFIGVFDGGAWENLCQPGGGFCLDALQNIVMNQAQFRKFAGHNSAVFNWVVDTDGGAGKLAGVRWVELRQAGDNQPWTLYQEGTYTAPDDRHAWCASIIMDGNGNIGMGYASLAGPDTPDPTNHRVSAYYTGRFDGDPLGTMTVSEELIAAGNGNIPGNFGRYGDYHSINIDPTDDATFWYINEYYNSGRKGVVGVFQLGPNTITDDIGVNNITAPIDGPLTANENITIYIKNFGINDIINPEVQYDIDGGTPVVENYGGTLAAGATESYTFATQADLSIPGDYEIAARTNLGGDTNPGNDEISKTVTNGGMYCQPLSDCSFGDGITKFVLETINNNPIPCGTGYDDFTNISTTLEDDTAYTVTVQTGYDTLDEKASMWIDFNNNGDFEPSEQLFSNVVINPDNSDVDIDFTIPSGAASGERRLRIRCGDTSFAGDLNDPCNSMQYGTTHDYTVIIDGVLAIEDISITEADLVITSKTNKQFDISLITDFDGIASISIYNTLGQTLAFNNLEKEGNAFNYNLDMSYAAPGVYFIKIGDRSSNSFKSAKIIVK
jgi:hypothetical protein